MSGLGRPFTRLSHHGTSTEWTSRAVKLRVAAATWTAAMQAIGLSAICMAIAVWCSSARSPIFLVSRMPPAVKMSGCITASAPDSSNGLNPSFRYMSSPVARGVVVEFAMRTYWSVYCHGTGSSIQDILYFSSRFASLMQSSTGICPRWSIASGISYPISARTSAMYFSR